MLTWNAVADYTNPPSTIVGYDVDVGSALYGRATGTAETVTGLSASTAYSFTIVAVNANGVFGPASQPVSVTTHP